MKKNKKYFLKKLEYSILNDIVSETGIVVLSILLSGRSVKRMHQVKNEMRKRKDSRARTLKNLESQGYVRVQNEKVVLTKLGKAIYLQNKVIDSHKSGGEERGKRSWDGKWRMVSFDIPNDLQSVRDLLRRILLKSGFMQIQKSVYIYPHEVKELIYFLRKHKDFKKYIIYSEISFSTNSEEWMKVFRKSIKCVQSE